MTYFVSLHFANAHILHAFKYSKKNMNSHRLENFCKYLTEAVVDALVVQLGTGVKVIVRNLLARQNL